MASVSDAQRTKHIPFHFSFGSLSSVNNTVRRKLSQFNQQKPVEPDCHPQRPAQASAYTQQLLQGPPRSCRRRTPRLS